MKRLTEKNESPCTCCGGIGSCRADCSYKQIYDRLAEYEDTGLTPKEIEDMVSVREITPEAEYAIDKHANNLIQKLDELITKTDEKNELQRYKEAEEQGLLEWLPCKLGDTVYRVIRGKKGRGHIAPATVSGLHLGDTTRNRRYQKEYEYLVLRVDGGFCAHVNKKDIGKTVFLTREEAEKALEEVCRKNT